MGLMTITSTTAVARRPHDIKRALAWTILTVAGACAVAYLSLANVSGVTKNADGSCCDVEFINGSWWNLAFALGYPVYRAARASYWLAPAAVLVATVVQLYVADTVVGRYAESGWGDGLESLSYFWAVLMGLFFTSAAVAGGVVSVLKRRRERPDHVGAMTE